MTQMTVKEIKEELSLIMTLDELNQSIYRMDERKSVQNLIATATRKLKKEEKLKERFKEMKQYELRKRRENFCLIAGIDEVGRGPLAGPVVSAAVILPEDFDVIEVNDSKQLSEKKRETLYDKIMKEALSIGIGIKDQSVIDSVNIYEATKLAMKEAVNQLEIKPDYLLIDAMVIDSKIPQEKIIKGDAKSISIACASIIAKVTRDRLMKEYHKEYPGYDFDKNAGYGTKAHLLGLKKYGITPIHRKSFAPIKEMV